MKKFESLDSPKFNKLEVESMKRLKGGYTLNTVTVYSSGNVNDDGNACKMVFVMISCEHVLHA